MSNTPTAEPKVIDYDDFLEKYKPHLDEESESLRHYEWHEAKDVEALDAVKPEQIWTLLDGDNGLIIESGRRYVNRLAYIITEIPAEPEEIIQILIDNVDEE